MGTSRVAVIGAGLGGLSAAGALAKAGCDVTVFEATPNVGGKAQAIHARGVTLDTGPTLLTLPKVVHDTFAALGAEDLVPRFTELPLQCRYVFADDCRFEAYCDLERTAASAAELRPSEARGIHSFYSEAEQLFRDAGEPYLEAPFEGMTGFMARVLRRGPGAVARGLRMGTLDDLARRHFRTDHLRQFVGRFATYVGASPWESSAAFALIPHIERVYGVHHVEGGMGALARSLAAAVQRQGATLRFGAKVRWQRERAQYRVWGGGHEGVFDIVVVNADPLTSLGRSDERLALSGYVLLLQVDERLSLPHHTVLFSKDYRGEFDALFSGRVPVDPTIYVCHPAATDPSMAEERRSGLFVMVNAPPLADADEATTWGAHAARLRRLCLDRLERLVPGLRAKAHVVAERTPVDLLDLGAPAGSIYGFLPHGRFGPFRRPKMRGEAPGLFFAGGGTHPGGGVPMVMLSGRFAAQLALRHLQEVAR